MNIRGDKEHKYTGIQTSQEEKSYEFKSPDRFITADDNSQDKTKRCSASETSPVKRKDTAANDKPETVFER